MQDITPFEDTLHTSALETPKPALFGETYRRYQAKVPAFFPHPKKWLRRGEALDG